MNLSRRSQMVFLILFFLALVFTGLLWDKSATHRVISLSRKSFALDAGMVFASKWLILTLPVVLGFRYFRLQKSFWVRRLAVACALAVFAYFLSQLIQLLWYRPAPFEAFGIEPLIEHRRDASFPSDHVTVASVFAAYLFSTGRPYGAIGIMLVFALGLARVYCALHWISDLLGGLVLGGAIGYAAARLHVRGSSSRRTTKPSYGPPSSN